MMHLPITGAGVWCAAVALFFAVSVSPQRSSPQFSFPPPNSAGNQFGADVFSTGNQDLSLLQPVSSSNANPLGSPSSPLSLTSLSSSSSSSSNGNGQLDQSSIQQPQQPQQQPQQQQPQQQQPTIQLSRPSLSLSSLQAPQLSSSQSSQSQSSSSANTRQSTGAQSSRHHNNHHSQPSTPLRGASVAAGSSTSTANHQAAASSVAASNSRGAHSTSHLTPQATSQSLNANNNQAAIDAARKAEASAASLAATSSGSYQCPDSFGFFRHHKSCDKYWACENGTSTLKLCGNGLMFEDSDPKRENCAYPFSVDCGDRSDLEPPISTPHCPRLYGLFADTTNCRVFYSCWNGEASKYECPPGLAYDNEQHVCVWADLVERCDQSEVSDGFVCPDPSEVDQPGHYTRHAHPTDCRKFYVCIEGVARPYGCSLGTVFNVDSLQCDEPENVGGCEKYYGDTEPKKAKKPAREAVQPVREGSSSGYQQPSRASLQSSSSTSSSSSSSN